MFERFCPGMVASPMQATPVNKCLASSHFGFPANAIRVLRHPTLANAMRHPALATVLPNLPALLRQAVFPWQNCRHIVKCIIIIIMMLNLNPPPAIISVPSLPHPSLLLLPGALSDGHDHHDHDEDDDTGDDDDHDHDDDHHDTGHDDDDGQSCCQVMMMRRKVEEL